MNSAVSPQPLILVMQMMVILVYFSKKHLAVAAPARHYARCVPSRSRTEPKSNSAVHIFRSAALPSGDAKWEVRDAQTTARSSFQVAVM
jgi:hypothetical protein